MHGFYFSILQGTHGHVSHPSGIHFNVKLATVWLTISCKYTMVIKNDNSDQRGHNDVSQLLQRGNRLVQGFCCCFVIPTSRAAEEKAQSVFTLRRMGPLCPEGL
jgi:hypothetical protein